MYKLVVHRYGKAEISEHSSLKEALRIKEYIEDFGEGFVEFVLDENNKVLKHGYEHVIGIELDELPIGKLYDVEKQSF